MYRSKRFIAFCVATGLFVLMIYTTPYQPMEIAGALSIITGIYIGAQAYRKSDKEIG